eukprot:CAMPEP_0167757354 /NCGR_PEP_ID=MMETSP0110_2-20121227/9878_1 /TAXON_ID=629695 /ORGANISM="Gymnochlora sp., Strain CCMP2014" /LENGTH=185 /DNA_ID=CAMNT_0007643533 /DNA_START=136 /DNA_END=693 /DNA_ORIENTATION=+
MVSFRRSLSLKNDSAGFVGKDEEDYFRLFSLPSSFEIEGKELEKTYKKLQQQTHPDQFANKPLAEQRAAEDKSSYVNQAYQTLRDPMLRGKYMLKVNGESIEEDIVTDATILVEVMEYQEQLGISNDQKVIEEIYNNALSRYEELLGLISISFDEGNLQTAKSLLQELSYFDTICRRATAKLDVK